MKRSAFLTVAAMGLASSAMAVETTGLNLGLNNQYMSNGELAMSPAQIMNFDKSKADLTLSQSNSDYKESSVSTDYVTNGIKGAAYYKSDAAPFVFGVTANSLTTKIEDFDTTSSRTVFQPEFAYQLPADVTIGLSHAVVTDKLDLPAPLTDTDIAFNQTKLGAMWKADALEIGLAHATEVDEKDESNGNSITRNLPAKTTVHGRYAMNNTMAFGGAISNSDFTAAESTWVDETYGKDGLETADKMSVKAFVEMMPMDELKVEGILAYRGAADEELFNGFRAPVNSTGIEANAIYRPATNWETGGGLAYATGDREYTEVGTGDKIKVESDETKISVFGGMRF